MTRVRGGEGTARRGPPPREAGEDRAAVRRFLASLRDGTPLAASRVALVVAHPDDETIALGARLPRLPGITVVHVTDGAPRSGGAAQAHGFPDPEAYAAARRRELGQAMSLAGVPSESLVALGVPDQGTPGRMAEVARRLADLLDARGIEVAVTHAYEGGHPDHDATAFAVHEAARLLAARGRPVGIVEAPFYHLAPDGSWAIQAFCDEAPGPSVALPLDEAGRALKRAMLDAHATQAGVLSMMRLDAERLREAPAHDFARLPNGGALLYERHGWGLTGERWLDLVRRAREELP